MKLKPSPRLAWPWGKLLFRLLWNKGGGLSRPSTESRRREDCSVAAVSRRRRWPTRRRCVVSRWKGKAAGRGREGILPRHHSLRCPSISGRLSVLPFASKSGISRPREVALPDRAISDGGLRICVADLCAAGHLFAGIARRARGAVRTALVRSGALLCDPSGGWLHARCSTKDPDRARQP